MKSLIKSFEDSIDESFEVLQPSILTCIQKRVTNDKNFQYEKYINNSRRVIKSMSKRLIQPSLFVHICGQSHTKRMLLKTYSKLFETGMFGLLYMNNQSLSKVLQSLKDLMIQKRKDYGTGNILAFGHVGVILRMSDKVERLQNLLGSSKKPTNESVLDSYQDLVNYSLIGIMLLNNTFERELKDGKS